MKTFVYDKKKSKKVAEIKNVATVCEDKPTHSIQITTLNNETFEFETRFFKTTAYQN